MTLDITGGNQFKGNVNQNHFEDGYLTYLSPFHFSYNLSALAISKHQVPNPGMSKSIEGFESLYTDVWGPFLKASFSGSRCVLTIIDDFVGF
jgi:hypothetical protein